jgi:hypothetical protein
LDRLIRGRLWIGIIGFALIGIVAMQVAVLRMNTGLARGLESKAALMREISSAQVAASTLGSATHVEAEAAHRGMELTAAGPAAFLGVGRGDSARAAWLLANGPAKTPVSESAAAAPLTAQPTTVPAGAVAGAEAGSATSGAPAAGSTATTVGSAAGSEAATTVALPATQQASATTPTTPAVTEPSTTTATGPATGAAEGGAVQAPGSTAAAGAAQAGQG